MINVDVQLLGQYDFDNFTLLNYDNYLPIPIQSSNGINKV